MDMTSNFNKCDEISEFSGHIETFNGQKQEHHDFHNR